jgi:N-dimethylarginine dimethylaminohydrolase
VLVSGYSFRSDAAAITELGRILGCPIKAVQLVDPRLYHLDLTFCPLDERRAICAPTGWDSYGRKVVEALVPEPLWLEEDEALSFCANSVVVGTTVVMPSTPVRVGRQLEAWGFTVVESPVGEFLKAGGGCRCLTLSLDTVLTPGLPAVP